MSAVDLRHGDCLEVLRGMADNSVDSIVTDPPYGLSFMGKKWDYDVPSVEVWAECLRVLKPGGHLLAFAGTRTQHRMAVRIEDAGFEIRDMIAWVYSTGFPKSLDVSKAIDKAAGAEREVVGVRTFADGSSARCTAGSAGVPGSGAAGQAFLTAPATDAARQWQGWGTALKPALEPITVARKPLISTVAENVLAHGTGALNIDGCRVESGADYAELQVTQGGNRSMEFGMGRREFQPASGRWPANLIHDGSEEVLAAFPQAKGQQGAVGPQHGAKNSVNCFGDFGPRDQFEPRVETETSAARFFYCAKASRADRNNNCEELTTWESVDLSPLTGALSELKKATSGATTLLLDDIEWSIVSCGSESTARFLPAIKSIIETVSRTTTGSTTSCSSAHLSTSESIRDAISIATESGSSLAEIAESFSQYRRASTDESMASVLSAVDAVLLALSETSKRGKQGNVHSTVKPTDLMRYLIRLVTPPGGTVLDPFMGSGSTGRGAVLEGFRFIGIEREAEYAEIARARIAAVTPKPAPAPEPENDNGGQFDLFEGTA